MTLSVCKLEPVQNWFHLNIRDPYPCNYAKYILLFIPLHPEAPRKQILLNYPNWIYFITWSYTLRRAGAILFVNVPATMMTSAWRGEARKTTPNLSISYRGAAMCIISTAQQARPKVRGHSEP